MKKTRIWIGKKMETKIQKRMEVKGVDAQTRIMMNMMAIIIGINIINNIQGIIRALKGV